MPSTLLALMAGTDKDSHAASFQGPANGGAGTGGNEQICKQDNKQNLRR